MSNDDDYTARQYISAHRGRLRAAAFAKAMFLGHSDTARTIYYSEEGRSSGYEFAVFLSGLLLDVAHRATGSEQGVRELLTALADADHLSIDVHEGIDQLGDTDDNQKGGTE